MRSRVPYDDGAGEIDCLSECHGLLSRTRIETDTLSVGRSFG